MERLLHCKTPGATNGLAEEKGFAPETQFNPIDLICA
jgi:hypothetical protein